MSDTETRDAPTRENVEALATKLYDGSYEIHVDCIYCRAAVTLRALLARAEAAEWALKAESRLRSIWQIRAEGMTARFTALANAMDEQASDGSMSSDEAAIAHESADMIRAALEDRHE